MRDGIHLGNPQWPHRDRTAEHIGEKHADHDEEIAADDKHDKPCRQDALEAEGRDPIEGGYRLEVSSPGIDRPLTRLADFDDWKGHEARVTLADQINGRKQFSGTLAGSGEGNSVHLSGKDGNDYVIPFSSIHSAKLLLTDKLINATAPLSTEGADTIQTVED